MKRIKSRAGFALIIAAAIICGLLLFFVKLAADGGDWAMFRANSSVYKNGVLSTGTLTDRNGTVLAKAGDGVFGYADEWAVRRAVQHAVGDYQGNIGTGALTVFADRLAGYSILR